MTKHMFSMENGKSFASALDVGCNINIQKAPPSRSNKKKIKDNIILNCSVAFCLWLVPAACTCIKFRELQ